ncbi:glycosyltransferase [Actinophytocola sp.]|uniref:glycosyltransferase n=1 Tax=Actinophytocola sp. TaxID=1872138 RepID=UPI002D5BCD92|nr:glycosyltransferase [Actinophytocola sp.]HYQ67623.1 glycosyltransferase [Actinophytocola sp.]
MKILFSSRPAYGHLLPLLPLANAARAAGHEVVLGTGETFVGRARQLGFDAHRVGIAVGEAEAEARRRHGANAEFIDVGVTMFCELIPNATVADLTPLLPRLRPDLVVYEQSDVGAGIAARHAGIPAVSHVIGRSMPAPILAVAARRLAPLWGTPPADAFFGDACVDLWPDSLRDPGTAAVPTLFRARPTPFDLDVPLPPVPDSGRPLVYLTLGTVAHGATTVLRAAVDGLARLPVDVLVALGPGDPAALGELPAHVLAAGFVPQAAVLRRAALVVHHGGTGTVLGALAAGLPQVVLPLGADQFVNAETLDALGAGRSLVGDAITADAVEEAARVLLSDPTARDTARGVAAEIAAMPAPDHVLTDIVGWVDRPPRHGRQRRDATHT